MTREDFLALVREQHIGEGRFNLTGVGNEDNMYVMRCLDNGSYEVYYSEHGQKFDRTVHPDSSDALDDLYKRLTDGAAFRKLPPFFPLGSVVLLNGARQELVIINRGLHVKDDNGKIWYFDYAGVLYPNGMIDNNLVYFQANQIAVLRHMGFSDAREETMLKYLIQFRDGHPEVERGSSETFAQ